MSATRAKRIRKLMMVLGDSGIQAEAEASYAKLHQPNRHGDAQHRRINPIRQMKKRVAAAYPLLRSGKLTLNNQPGENPMTNTH